MEATVNGAAGATLEFRSKEEPGGFREETRTRYFCLLKAGHIWAWIELEDAPEITTSGVVFDRTQARVSTAAHDVYPENTPMFVKVAGWGPGYEPGCIPSDPADWHDCLGADDRGPYTTLLQEESLEELARVLLRESANLRREYLVNHFRILLARYLVFPDQPELDELLDEYEQCDDYHLKREQNPIFRFVEAKVKQLVYADQSQLELTMQGVTADLYNGLMGI